MNDISKRMRARRVVHWGHATGETPQAIGTKPDAECVEAADEIDRLRAVVKANHEWHLNHDDHGGYLESELHDMNTKGMP